MTMISLLSQSLIMPRDYTSKARRDVCQTPVDAVNSSCATKLCIQAEHAQCHSQYQSCNIDQSASLHKEEKMVI